MSKARLREPDPDEERRLRNDVTMNILYIAPDVPVPHTGEFLGGATHVLKVAESLARRGCEVFIISRRMRGQRKCEKILRMRLTCKGGRCLRRMGGFISQSILYMKGDGWNEC